MINSSEFDDSNNAVLSNANAVSNDAINFLLLIQNSSICKSKERLVEALNRFRREASNILTQRKSSEFEFVDRSFQFTIRLRECFSESERRRNSKITNRIAK